MRSLKILAAALSLAAMLAPARADLFGESDEEKAARIQHEQNQDSAIQSLTQRVRDLEDSLRQATGQNENLSHRVQELNERLERQQRDFEYRLCVMSAQQLGPAPGGGNGPELPCNASTASPAQNAPPPEGAQGGPPPQGPQTGRPPGNLGTLSSGDPMPLAPPPQRSQFEIGVSLAGKGQYDEARAAFRSFADANPRDAHAPQAIYWIGKIAYLEKDWAGASRAFAEVIKKYPDSPGAPESFLKLGQSLIASGAKKDGCGVLAQFKKRYREAPHALADQVKAARHASCRHVD
ncbi:MAG: tol-pal system protein YbgF [Alphaproteobacteria bacterium]|nr:tol-pal system protein YbgF [Alphaproteobacteria bacterium]